MADRSDPPADAAPSPADAATPWAAATQGMDRMLAAWPTVPGLTDPDTLARARDWWMQGLALWGRALDPAVPARPETPEEARDRRFADPRWREDPGFDLMRRSYRQFGDAMMRGVEGIEGVDPARRDQLRFMAKTVVEAMSPTNFPLTNPQVLDRAVETGGDSLAQGMRHLLADLARGQLTHTAADAFEVGRNLAVTPGAVILRTPLFELIQYAPATPDVLATPLVIFPPWINRFYILDLTPEKSFIRWAVEQGITVFMVSWKSADASMKEVVWDDYVAAQIEAIDTIRGLLDVPSVHAIGYCVAGTTLAATLALLAARADDGHADDGGADDGGADDGGADDGGADDGGADRKAGADTVASATFFTAQVDFADAGELLHFVTDEQLTLLDGMSPDGFLDGRIMAATFNALRGRDLIWNYVTSNYLMGQDYAAFDLLHWNGDTTNLPSRWHMSYLRDLYRDNALARPGGMSVAGTPIDLGRVRTPAYIQAGREDHIAPAASVWKLTHHLAGPVRFVLAGSGHIAGVVNPPAAGKYQYWTNDADPATLDAFVAGATETKGSWWPDWLAWLRGHDATQVPATGARVPGTGRLPALEPAPGSYVRQR